MASCLRDDLGGRLFESNHAPLALGLRLSSDGSHKEDLARCVAHGTLTASCVRSAPLVKLQCGERVS
eukprot:1955865-Prymnesium_polylepis.1